MSMKPFTYLAPIAPFEYLRPNTLDEAVETLDIYGDRAKLLAGGTDLTILLKDRAIKPEVIIDISRLRKELAGITVKDNKLMIGALTTFTELERDANVKLFAQALSEGASLVGTYQIRNLGTIGGNLANASPSADSGPPLIALSGLIHIRCQHGERSIPVEHLFMDVKKTVLSPNDIITGVELPANEKVSSRYVRAQKRNENALSIVSVAVASQIEGNRFGASRVSLGSAAPTPILCESSSERLSGSLVCSETFEVVARFARDECVPSKRALRAGPEYRRHLVYVLTKRAIQEVSGIAR